VIVYQNNVKYPHGICEYEKPDVFSEAVGYDELPDDFEILILDNKPYKPKNWNHGYSYGLALSRVSNEILFYQSVW
jgi:hypothetical protein